MLLAAYAVVRFGFFSTGLPTIEERSTGYLLGTLSPEQVRARFGENLIFFHLYNVASSALSVLMSEPRSGVWAFVRAIRGDQVAPRHFIQIGASLFATGLVVAYVVSRLRSGVRRPQTLADRHTVIFALILAANASISYVYTKDEIMSVAGAFYALPVFGAAVYFLRAVAGTAPLVGGNGGGVRTVHRRVVCVGDQGRGRASRSTLPGLRAAQRLDTSRAGVASRRQLGSVRLV